MPLIIKNSLKKTDYNAKTNDIEGKIPSASDLGKKKQLIISISIRLIAI